MYLPKEFDVLTFEEGMQEPKRVLDFCSCREDGKVKIALKENCFVSINESSFSFY